MGISTSTNSHVCFHCNHKHQLCQAVLIPVAENMNICKHQGPWRMRTDHIQYLTVKKDNCYWSNEVPKPGTGHHWMACPKCGGIGVHGFTS